jgi:hypothetical protein
MNFNNVHESPRLVAILYQISPTNVIIRCLCKLHFNIILLSVPVLIKYAVYSGLFVHFNSFMRDTAPLMFSLWFYRRNNFW